MRLLMEVMMARDDAAAPPDYEEFVTPEQVRASLQRGACRETQEPDGAA